MTTSETTTGLTPLQERELKRALTLLTGMGCEFCVQTPGGETYGTLRATTDKRARSVRQHPYGAITAHARQHLKLDVPAGHTQRLPTGQYLPQRVQSSVCALVRAAWGEGAGVTSTGEDYVEVLRLFDNTTKGEGV